MGDADLDMVVRGTLFASVGTQGQRCTTARRLIVHESVYDNVLERLKKAYQQVKVGDPLEGAGLYEMSRVCVVFVLISRISIFCRKLFVRNKLRPFKANLPFILRNDSNKYEMIELDASRTIKII